MYNIISGDGYTRNMPVVGMTPRMYTINGLNTLIQPRVDYQFYNPWTGSLGPNFTNGVGLNNGLNINGLNTNGLNTNGVNLNGICAEIYNKNGVSVNIVGTSVDIEKIKKCLDAHLTTL